MDDRYVALSFLDLALFLQQEHRGSTRLKAPLRLRGALQLAPRFLSCLVMVGIIQRFAAESAVSRRPRSRAWVSPNESHQAEDSPQREMANR